MEHGFPGFGSLDSPSKKENSSTIPRVGLHPKKIYPNVRKEDRHINVK